MSSPATKNVSAQTKTPTPQKKVVAKKEAATDKPPAKPRKPTLKEKHSRFLVSNYSLIQFLSAKGLMIQDAVETAYSEIKLFAPVDEQEAFYESYITESKTTKKTMKKFITQRNKPPKAPRAKKERQPKAKNEGEAPKEKKPRAKKTTKVKNDTEVDVVSQIADGAQDLVNELTTAANASPSGVNVETTPPAAATSDEVPGAPKKKTRKPRAKKEAAEPKEKKEAAEPKEKKPRAKKAKADVVVEAPPVQVQEEEEEEEEIHTQEITINGSLYLIDGENNLYSTETHEQVGTYNTEANEIVAMA